MDRNALGIVVLTLVAVVLLAIDRRISPPKKIEPTPPSKPQAYVSMPVIASIILWFISGLLIGIFVQSFSLSFIFALIPFVLSLPFTYLASSYYRKKEEPSRRYELLATVLGGALGLLLLWIIATIGYWF